MKFKIEDCYLIFEPENDYDTYLIGRLVERNNFTSVRFFRCDKNLSITEAKIKSADLLDSLLRD